MDDVSQRYGKGGVLMELEQKKEHALRCIRLGMSLEDSLFISECTVEEMDMLEQDDQFLTSVERQQKLEEMALLKQFNIASEIAVSRGSTKPLEWKLGLLNSKRYSSKSTNINIMPENQLPVVLTGAKVNDNN